jgi:hypothetical protein
MVCVCLCVVYVCVCVCVCKLGDRPDITPAERTPGPGEYSLPSTLEVRARARASHIGFVSGMVCIK